MFVVDKMYVLLEIYSVNFDCGICYIMASLQDIIALGKNKLKHVRTTCTTADGKQVCSYSS